MKERKRGCFLWNTLYCINVIDFVISCSHSWHLLPYVIVMSLSTCTTFRL